MSLFWTTTWLQGSRHFQTIIGLSAAMLRSGRLLRKRKILFISGAALTVGFVAAAPYLHPASYPGSKVFIRGPVAAVLGIAQGLHRSTRAVYTFTVNTCDYKYSLHGYDKKSEDYLRILSEVHYRAAERILMLCQANGGFYTKAGQFLASLGPIPREYSSVLAVLKDQAQFWPYEAIRQVFMEEFGRSPFEIYKAFEKIPIAAASLAQVHRAIIEDGQEVAVKVQYPGLERQCRIDLKTMQMLSRAVAWMFPDYQFEWMVPEFENDISRELDFLQEGSNAERASKNFLHRKQIKVPRIFWDMTSSRVLTMEYIHGCKVDDIESLEKNGIDPKKVAHVLVEAFAEMIFCHGFVHGDPHSGNILIRKTYARQYGHNFELVLLDHGLYRQLGEQFRSDFCRLWKAMILLDPVEMQDAGECLGAGQYYHFLPVLLTGRSFGSKSALGKAMSQKERSLLKVELQNITMGDISQFMEGLSRDFLTVIRTDGILRSIIKKLGVHSRVRAVTYARYAVVGHIMQHPGVPSLWKQGLVNYTKGFANYMYLCLRLEFLELKFALQDFCISLRTYIVSISAKAYNYFQSLKVLPA